MSDSRAGVSVVVPAFNRGRVIGRAVESALRQTRPPIEILIVDDCSSDDTCAVVESMAARDARIRLIRCDRNRGGGAARNAGIAAATGELLAFLDSDDEWSATHLERKVGLLTERAAGLVFGSFHRHDGRRRLVQRCEPLEGDPLEYLYLSRGGFRTSTFVCEKRKMRDVMFDDELRKHQDWDLMINFHRRFPVATDTQATAILHIDGADRLSGKLDHEASARFYRKNRPHCSRIGWVLFATVMLERTYRDEGRGPHFLGYLESVREIDASAYAAIRSFTPLLRVPSAGGRLFRAACRRYCVVASQRRPHLLEAGSSN